MRMAKLLSDADIRKLPTGDVYYEAALPGFGVRVSNTGVRAFVYNYRTRATGRERRITIGRYPNWTVGAARTEARRLRQLIDQGHDPLGDLETQRTAPTMADLIERFQQEHLPRLRDGTQRYYRGLLRRHIGPHFGSHVKVTDVAFADADALHRKITKSGAAYEANRTLAVLSKMFTLAIRWQMCTVNPCKSVERNSEAMRRRCVTSEELPRLIEVLATYPDRQAVDIIRLMMFTGARSGEVKAMRWDDLDLAGGKWNKPSSSTKQKKDHTVPLSMEVQQLLERQPKKGTWVFPSADSRSGHVVRIERAWHRICKAANIEGLRMHDLRHSFASQLASGGASLPLIGALLGHSNPKTTARYTHLFDDVQRDAVERVAAIHSAAIKPGRKHG
jgi:integrase